MNIFKSLQKRFIVTLFFIFSFTFAILTFSIGNSAINAQRIKAKKYNKENNKILSFIETSDISVKDLVKKLENEKVTITAFKLDSRRDIEAVTVLQDKGINISENMKEGSFYTSDEFKSKENGGIYSTVLEDKVIEITSDITDENILINKDSVYFDTKSKLILTNKTFEKLYTLDNANSSNLSVILSGEKEALDSASEIVEKYSKSVNANNNLLIFPYLLQDRSLEGESLYFASILIVIITIINSISICSLWIEGRKKEIILRKTFGATNKDIAKIFFLELLIISIIATVIALITQYILIAITGGYISNISIKITTANFIYSAILAILTAFLSSLPSLIHLQKVQPVELLREE